MKKIGTPINIQANGTWEGNYGLMYKFEIEMDNGDIGEYSSKIKEQTKFEVDKVTEYEFIDGDFPKIKPVFNYTGKAHYRQQVNNEDVQKYIVRQSSLDRSVTVCVAQGIFDDASILAKAETFADWVMLDDEKSNTNKSESVEKLPFS